MCCEDPAQRKTNKMASEITFVGDEYGQKWRRTTKKSVEGESGRKRENTTRIYISSKDVQRLKGSRKDCKMIFQARTAEK